MIDEFQVAVVTAPEAKRQELARATERAIEVLTFSDIGPNQVRVASRHITTVAPLVVFMDEFDQISDVGTLSLVSNTIKLLSDQI